MGIVTTSIKAQQPSVDTIKGYRIINVDLTANPQIPIQYADTPDTIFVYEKTSNNTLVLINRYFYDTITRTWFPLKLDRPSVKIRNHKRKDVKIVNIKAIKQK